jgi:pyruvate,water dikinase
MTRVLDSTYSRRVVDYCNAQGLDRADIKMAIIVQRLVPGRVSGVCFTQAEDQVSSLIIEACYGLGEPLVSGRITPDSYLVDRNSLSMVKESIGYQKFMLRVVPESGNLSYEAIPFFKRNAKKLTREEIKSIASMCLEVEQRLEFGATDIEWTIESSSLYLLQARPYAGVAAKDKE